MKAKKEILDFMLKSVEESKDPLLVQMLTLEVLLDIRESLIEVEKGNG